MNMPHIATGDRVVVAYKSGEYIAEVLEVSPPKALVKILAVHKHPAQGDLHHPMEVDVPLFHQRRALSYQEKVYVMLSHMRVYRGNVPDYRESLERAMDVEIQTLRQTIRWAERSLQEFAQLENDYFPGRDRSQP